MKFNIKKSGKRGFSLAEVIVALAVIVIVSSAALSLISSHSRLEREAIETIEAAEIAESVIESFRWYKNNSEEFDSEEFDRVLSAIGLIKNGEYYTYGVKDAEGETIRNYRVYIPISENSIRVSIMNGDGDSVIIQQNYNFGGAVNG